MRYKYISFSGEETLSDKYDFQLLCMSDKVVDLKTMTILKDRNGNTGKIEPIRKLVYYQWPSREN